MHVVSRLRLKQKTCLPHQDTLKLSETKEGVDRNVRAEIAGHTDADTTDKYYRQVYDGEAGEAIKKMAHILGLDEAVAAGDDDAN